MNTDAAMADCALWAGSGEESDSGVLPCPSSFLSSTALVSMTADDTGGGIQDTTISLREGGKREGGGREGQEGGRGREG